MRNKDKLRNDYFTLHEFYIKAFDKHGKNSISLQPFNGPFLLQVIRILLHTINNFYKHLTISKLKIIPKENTCILSVCSQNTYDSLKFLSCNPIFKFFSLSKSVNLEKNIPFINYYGKILYIKKFTFVYYFFLVSHFRYAIHNPFLIFVSIGYIEHYNKIIKKLKPKLIVFANDHNIESRAFLIAALECKIKTVYIQHASVSNLFPRLIFDLNLLEGQISYDQYQSNGVIRGITKLIGIPKLDNYVSKDVNYMPIHHYNKIGICYNLADNINNVKFLVLSLSKKYTNINFIIRPHPRDKRTFLGNNYSSNISFSNPRQENSLDFIKNLDLIISGYSNIILEAALLAKKVVYYKFSKNINHDYFGFIKNNIAIKTETIDGVEKQLNKSFVPNINNLKKYNDVIGTNRAGLSGTLAQKYIEELLLNDYPSK